MHKRLGVKLRQSGFTIVEILVSLVVVTVLLIVMTAVLENGFSINGKTQSRAEAGSLAFKKIQDYINLDFDSIPIGDGATSYEVEDFSAEAEALNLNNASAKIFIEPESELATTATSTTTSFSQTIAADAAFVSGSEINSIGYHDATGDWDLEWRIRDDNYSNYTYSRYAGNPDTLGSPSIDLGSPQDVDFIRVDWYGCGYGASNFRVEAKNSSPNSNSGWTTIVGGLTDNGIPCVVQSNPQDIDVSANTTNYRYWRLYFVDAQNSNYAVISELEAFSAGVPGDIVEQRGSSASSAPGELFFSSSDLEMSENGSAGQQSVGIIFDNVDTPQAATIDNAYIEFTADESNSGDVTLKVSAADVDNAQSWVGSYAVDRAVDNDGSDGSVGTSAVTTWSPTAWTAGDIGTNTQVDVTAIVQELIDRAGWVSDNDMAFAVQYISGSDKRVATRNPAPRLIIDWSETTTAIASDYVDNNGDGDVDNPTLVRMTATIQYESYRSKQEVTYSTLVRKFGVGN